MTHDIRESHILAFARATILHLDEPVGEPLADDDDGRDTYEFRVGELHAG